MSLPIEEVDEEGRAIFFKSPVDISKPVERNAYDLSTLDRVNDLYLDMRLPVPKFRGYVYSYSFFLTICSLTDRNRLEVKKKIEYDSIVATYPCEKDPALVFLIMANSRSRHLVRVLRFPSAIKGTKFRYIIDQLQMSPVHKIGNLRNESVRTTNNSGSSWSTPMAEESDASVTSASHYFNRSPAHNPTMRAFYARDEEELKLPRVRPFAFNSNLYDSRPSLRKSDIFDNFNSADYEIYRPVSRKSRVDRSDYVDSSRRPNSRRQRSRQRLESAGLNHNSRAAVRNKNYVYLHPENEDYRTHRHNYEKSYSRSGSAARRIPFP